MAVNALRKKGARMSLQEALERVDKLQRLSQSSNEHEAALAALRLQSFDIEAARAPKKEPDEEEDQLPDKPVEVLDEFPERPYREVGRVEVRQDPKKKTVNWEELHFELLKKAGKQGADAIVYIQLDGTISNKMLSGTALIYLNVDELYEIQEHTKKEQEEEIRLMEQKERRDEETAPGYD